MTGGAIHPIDPGEQNPYTALSPPNGSYCTPAGVEAALFVLALAFAGTAAGFYWGMGRWKVAVILTGVAGAHFLALALFASYHRCQLVPPPADPDLEPDPVDPTVSDGANGFSPIQPDPSGDPPSSAPISNDPPIVSESISVSQPDLTPSDSGSGSVQSGLPIVAKPSPKSSAKVEAAQNIIADIVPTIVSLISQREILSKLPDSASDQQRRKLTDQISVDEEIIQVTLGDVASGLTSSEKVHLFKWIRPQTDSRAYPTELLGYYACAVISGNIRAAGSFGEKQLAFAKQVISQLPVEACRTLGRLMARQLGIDQMIALCDEDYITEQAKAKYEKSLQERTQVNRQQVSAILLQLDRNLVELVAQLNGRDHLANEAAILAALSQIPKSNPRLLIAARQREIEKHLSKAMGQQPLSLGARKAAVQRLFLGQQELTPGYQAALRDLSTWMDARDSQGRLTGDKALVLNRLLQKQASQIEGAYLPMRRSLGQERAKEFRFGFLTSIRDGQRYSNEAAINIITLVCSRLDKEDLSTVLSQCLPSNRIFVDAAREAIKRHAPAGQELF